MWKVKLFKLWCVQELNFNSWVNSSDLKRSMENYTHKFLTIQTHFENKFSKLQMIRQKQNNSFVMNVDVQYTE